MENLKEQTVLFDPGFAQHTTILSISTEYIYNSVNQFKNFGQKKMKFKMFYPQIIKMTENNVGFCLGCLLWAAYIKGFNDVKIEGNPCLGDTYNKEEAVEEIDFSIAFFEQLKKDAKYYLGTEYEINPLYIKILELYKEFLVQNCSFVNTKTTADVILPESFIVPEGENREKIHSKIQEVISTGNLLDLTDVLELAYKG